MARSLLRQLEQIRRSETYTDTVSSVNTSAVAEPTASGTLEEDLNVIRTLMKDLKGTTNWYDSVPTYTNPANTGSDSSANLDTIAGNTLDAKTIILAVSDYGTNDNGYTVSGTSVGIIRDPLTTQYATSADRIGLPIYLSVTNSGTYYDEGGNENVCRIDVIDQDDNEFQDSSGNIIYGMFHDGADYATYSGTGEDVYIKFYADGAVCDLSDVTPTPTAVKFVYPQRKLLSSMQEWEWLRTDFISSWEGDVELVEDIANLWSFTGATDNDGDAGPFTNEGPNYILQTGPGTLKDAIDDLNEGVGDRAYTEDNYVVDGQTITASLDALDQQCFDNANAISAGAGEKYVESVDGDEVANVEHALPSAIIGAGGYTPDSTAGAEGGNMDVYVDGQLLAADTGSYGSSGGATNADRDYGETSTSGVTFRFILHEGRNVTYVVRQ